VLGTLLVGATAVPAPTDRLGTVRRLDTHAETIVEHLAAIGRRHPGEQLVVLCFENVDAGADCHRRWLAEWLEERYGVVVPELEASGMKRSEVARRAGISASTVSRDHPAVGRDHVAPR
jgi:hypothetical protein